MIGYVYILVNSAFPNLVKIGRTSKDSFSRADELSSTSSPSKFVVAYDQLVSDSIAVESILHEHFDEQRYSKNREFFEVSSKIAIDKLIEIASQFSCDSPISSINREVNYFTEPNINHFLYLAQIGLNDKKDVFYRIGALSSIENSLSDKFLSEVRSKIEKFYRMNDFSNYYAHEVEFLLIEKTETANVEFQAKSQELIVVTLKKLMNPSEDDSMNIGWSVLDFDGHSFVYRKFEKFLGQAQYFFCSIQEEISNVREEHEIAQVAISKQKENETKNLNYLQFVQDLGGNF